MVYFIQGLRMFENVLGGRDSSSFKIIPFIIYYQLILGGGKSLPPKKENKSNFCLVLRKKKINHISKTENRTKKVIYAKNERRVNSNLPCKFRQFRRKLNFWAPIAPFGRPWRPNAICCEDVKMNTSQGGEKGLHILSWETTNGVIGGCSPPPTRKKN